MRDLVRLEWRSVGDPNDSSTFFFIVSFVECRSRELRPPAKKKLSSNEGDRRRKGPRNSMEHILKWNQNMFAKILILKSMYYRKNLLPVPAANLNII